MVKSAAVLLLSLSFFLSFTEQKKIGRSYFVSPFQPEKAKSIQKIAISFADSIQENWLNLYYSEEKFPICFSRNITTAVCLDGLCRLVDITLYWEITGKYLGYSLENGKELSKREHVPFLESDYVKLNEILSDSLSALKFYSLEGISTPKHNDSKVDAISGPTVASLARWIVPEAAYTSFTIWHLAYGASRDSLMAYTSKNLLTSALICRKLQSADVYDQLRAFEWIYQSNLPQNQFVEYALKLLHGDNYYSSRQALTFLKRCNLEEDFLQKEVIRLLKIENFKIKNLAIDYFSSIRKISQPVANEMITLLNKDDYYLVNTVLNILSKRYQPDYLEQSKLSQLLKSTNVNVSNRVYYFLTALNSKSPDISRKLSRYNKMSSRKKILL